ncbi:MAG: hypothetical protein IJU16_08150 [Clostridia bacterium]|nr:hypothetical protein [Clostridia bacterium]
MKRVTVLIALLMLAALLFAGCNGQSATLPLNYETGDETVYGYFGDIPIYQTEMDYAHLLKEQSILREDKENAGNNDALAREVLQRKLLLQYAAKEGITPDETWVETTLAMQLDDPQMPESMRDEKYRDAMRLWLQAESVYDAFSVTDAVGGQSVQEYFDKIIDSGSQ